MPLQNTASHDPSYAVNRTMRALCQVNSCFLGLTNFVQASICFCDGVEIEQIIEGDDDAWPH